MNSNRLHASIVTARHDQPQLSEKFHILSSNLLALREQSPVQTITLTSAIRREGTSTVTANLGVALSYMNQKVLLIDTNFHTPIQHHLFGISNRVGFQEYLSSYASVQDVIQETDISGLHVITSGPVRSLQTNRYRFSQVSLFLRDIVDEYDFILLDAPPINPYSDVQNMIRLTDSCLLVVRADHTMAHEVRAASKSIRSVMGKFTGVVLNHYE